MHLLTPTIFSITIKNIENNILLFEEYNISRFITTTSLRRNVNEQSLLFNYLIENNINLVIDGKLNPIINCTKKVLKEKYGIDIEKISKGKSK